MPTFVIANDSQALADTLYETLHSDTEFFMLVPCTAETLSRQFSPAPSQQTPSAESQVGLQLQRLNLPAHRVGYRHLLHAIPLFAKDPRQSLSKELYPAVAEAMCYGDWKSVEYSIRRAIIYGWLHRDPITWSRCFADDSKPPSNKTFISTIAAMIR